MYEYSATMVVATVTVVNLFNGLNTAAWTGWVFFAVSFGIVLCWGFTVSKHYSTDYRSSLTTRITGNLLDYFSRLVCLVIIVRFSL
jgi:uncharacterized membrane protein YesL